jgi:hypothetical protein
LRMEMLPTGAHIRADGARAEIARKRTGKNNKASSR